MANLFRFVSAEHVQNALEGYLKSLSMIEDNEAVIHFKKVVGGLEIKVEKEKNND